MKIEINVINDILLLKQKHVKTWRDKPEWFWFISLIEEVAELGLSLIGWHKGPVDWELIQIAAICMNWAEMREENRRVIQ